MHVGLVYFFHRWLRFYISHDAVGSIAAVAVMALTMVAGVMLLLMPAISSCQAPPLHSEGSFTGRNQEPGLNVVLVCASSISLSTVSVPAFFWFKKAGCGDGFDYGCGCDAVADARDFLLPGPPTAQ